MYPFWHNTTIHLIGFYSINIIFICTGKPKNSCDALYHNICLTTVSGTELNLLRSASWVLLPPLKTLVITLGTWLISDNLPMLISVDEQAWLNLQWEFPFATQAHVFTGSQDRAAVSLEVIVQSITPCKEQLVDIQQTHPLLSRGTSWCPDSPASSWSSWAAALQSLGLGEFVLLFFHSWNKSTSVNIFNRDSRESTKKKVLFPQKIHS